MTNKPVYEEYKSFANPLFSPWLCNEEFIEINSNYPEWLPEIFQSVRYLQYVLAKQVVLIDDGDFIECGVYSGKSADIFASILDKFDKNNKQLFLLDSYEDLPLPNEKIIDFRTNSNFFTKGGVKGWGFDAIKNALSKHKCSIKLIKGWIPDTFCEIENKKFCFAHVDVDLYQSTLDSLNFIYSRMIKGGIILFDDYSFSMCTATRLATDDYLKDKPEPIIPLPSGQAILIKI